MAGQIRGGIIATGSALPAKVLTNDDLAKMVDTSDEWIRSRTGIQERHIADEKTTGSMLAAQAARKALDSGKIDPASIDLIIVATCTPDMFFPNTACLIQAELGLTKAAAFDVSAACSGFNVALNTASAYIATGNTKRALVIGVDTLTKYVDWKDRGTCILFGDGAGAAVVDGFTDGTGQLASVLGAEGGSGHLLTLEGGGSRSIQSQKGEPKPGGQTIYMNGAEVFKFAVRVMEDSIVAALQKANLSVDQIGLLIPHQANSRIINHACQKLGIPIDKVFVNLQKYGNTSAASIPIALDEAVRAGRLKKGDILVLTGFGAGLTYGTNILKWSV